MARRNSQYVQVLGDGQEYTVEDAMNTVGFGRYHWFLVFFAGMAWMGDAMEVMILSYLGPAVSCQWDLGPNQESLLTALVFAGMCVGTVIWGLLSDTRGRRTTFLASAALTCLAGAVSAAAPNYYVLLLSRMMVGAGLSGSPVMYSLLMELLPTPSRGVIMVAVELFWTLGTVFEAGLAWALINSAGWRPLLLISSAPLVLLLVFSAWLPESPRYLLSHGKVKEAEAVLEQIARWDQALLPPGSLVATVGVNGDILHNEEEEQQELLHEDSTKQSGGRSTSRTSTSPDAQRHVEGPDCSSSVDRQLKGLDSPVHSHKQQQLSDEFHKQEQELAPWRPSEDKSTSHAKTSSSSSSRAWKDGGASAPREDGVHGSAMPAQHRDGLKINDAHGHDEHTVLLLDDAERQLLLVSEGQFSVQKLWRGAGSAFSELLSPTLSSTTWLLWFSWPAAAFAYYGLVQLVTQLHMGAGEPGQACFNGALVVPGEDFLPVFVSAAAEIPAVAWAAASTSMWGRRAATASSLALTSVALLPLLLGFQGGIMAPPDTAAARGLAEDSQTIAAAVYASAGSIDSSSIGSTIPSAAAPAVDAMGQTAAAGFQLQAGLPPEYISVGTVANASFDWIGLGSLFMSRLFIMSAFTLLWVFTPELYPTSVRTFGLGVSNAAGRVGGILSPFVTVNLVQKGHGTAAAAVFAAAAAAAAVAVALVPRDTSGKALAESVAEISDVEHRQHEQSRQEQTEHRH